MIKSTRKSMDGMFMCTWLVHRLFKTLQTITKPGLWGHAFLQHGPEKCIACFVWSDGSSCEHQMSEPASWRGTPTGETWWPCIVVVTDGLCWPLYCLAIAWLFARAWGVNPERLRIRFGFPLHDHLSSKSPMKPPPPPRIITPWTNGFTSLTTAPSTPASGPPTTVGSTTSTSWTYTGAGSNATSSSASGIGP